MYKGKFVLNSGSSLAWGILWALQFLWFICLGLTFNWPAGPVEENSAILAISLTTIEVVLAVLAITLALGAIFSYTTFRRDIQLTARETAMFEASKSVDKHLSEHGVNLIRECLSDAQIVAQLQLEFKKLGIEDSDEASSVDVDSDWVPDDD